MIDEIVKIGESQSKILGAFSVDSDVLRTKANEILFDRGNLECLRRELITTEEFANLVLAHFQTSICCQGGIEEASVCPDYSALVQEISALVSTGTER